MNRTLPLLVVCALFAGCDALLDPAEPAGGYVDVSVGFAHTCALRGDGALFCWGDNQWGQLGVEGSGGSKPRRVRPNGRDAHFIQVDAGHFHTCALRWTERGGEPWCWGLNAAGQLGDGTEVDRHQPVRVRAPLLSEIRAGSAHTCAVSADRELWCWGRNRDGQLGIGGFQPSLVPARLPGLALWMQVDAGAAHTCAVNRHDAAFCWGNYYYPYSQFSVEDTRAPEPLPLVGGLSWRSIATGYSHTCGVTRAGAGFCVGYNQDGQVGNGDPGGYLALVDTLARVEADDDWVELSAGFNHSCGLTRAVSLYCWGDNSVGQLGDSTWTDRALPQRVLPHERWRVVRAGNTHTCGITATGRVVCWGDDAFGQLGRDAIVVGGPSHDSTPVPGEET